jgi:hypothetical protein
MIYTHISAQVPGEPDYFLLNARGMLFDEVTASSLLKVDLDGKVQDMPEGQYDLHQAGQVVHSALYRARPGVSAAMPTHTIAGMAVSALKRGRPPLTQTATRFSSRLARFSHRILLNGKFDARCGFRAGFWVGAVSLVGGNRPERVGATAPALHQSPEGRASALRGDLCWDWRRGGSRLRRRRGRGGRRRRWLCRDNRTP